MTVLRQLLSSREERRIPQQFNHIIHKYTADLTIKDLSDIGLVIIHAEFGFIPDGNIAGQTWDILQKRAVEKNFSIL